MQSPCSQTLFFNVTRGLKCKPCKHVGCGRSVTLRRPHLRCLASVVRTGETNRPRQSECTPAARAALFTGTYAMAAGIAITVAPTQTFGLLFNVHEVTTGWIRFGGILLTLIGMQYFGTGMQDTQLPATPGGHVTYSRSFYTSTILSRLYLTAGFLILVAMQQMPVGLLVLAALNFIGALAMFFAVKKTDVIMAEICSPITGVP